MIHFYSFRPLPASYTFYINIITFIAHVFNIILILILIDFRNVVVVRLANHFWLDGGGGAICIVICIVGIFKGHIIIHNSIIIFDI